MNWKPETGNWKLPFLVPDWPAHASVRAAMTTRAGGRSLAPFDSFNLGDHVGDDPAAVRENRVRLMSELNLAREPGWLRQVHGTRVVQLPAVGVAADASISVEPELACVVLVADCLPVLFCDETGSVVAAAHAGWRGLAAGVLEMTVKALPVAPARLLAWLGPAIGPQHFEVGSEVRAAFVAHDAGAAAAFQPAATPGKWLADLYALARQRLQQSGLHRIYGGGLCTYSDAARFYSYRRDGACGRMAALIWLQRSR